MLFLFGVFSPVALFARFDLGVFGVEPRVPSVVFLLLAGLVVRLVMRADIFDLTPSLSFSFFLMSSPEPLLAVVDFLGVR